MKNTKVVKNFSFVHTRFRFTGKLAENRQKQNPKRWAPESKFHGATTSWGGSSSEKIYRNIITHLE